MDKQLVSVVHLEILACALLVSGCAGTLTADSQSVNVGDVLVHTRDIATTHFHAVSGDIDFLTTGSVRGADSSMFGVAYPTTPLARGTSVSVEVEFRPSRLGEASAVFRPALLSGEPSNGSFPMTVEGKGVGHIQWRDSVLRVLNPPAREYDFGEVCTNASRTWNYLVTNTSANPIALAAIFAPAAVPAITVAPATLTVPPNIPTPLVITFTPTAVQDYEATLVLQSTASPPVRQVGVWIRGKGKDCSH